jgi:uncharacterized oxidoreductase
MQLTGNTILVTGGGTRIGRDLATSFHWLGNQVVIAGRGHARLQAVVDANPGMCYLQVDQGDRADIRRFTTELSTRYPRLNVVINNASISPVEDRTSADADMARSIEALNLLGPIRLIAALLPTLMTQPRAAIINLTSELALVSKAATPTYCAAKAALHAYTQLLRFQLRDTPVEVIDITHRTCRPASSLAHRIVGASVDDRTRLPGALRARLATGATTVTAARGSMKPARLSGDVSSVRLYRKSLPNPRSDAVNDPSAFTQFPEEHDNG